MSETISFEIKALQSDATTPIPNAEIQLENSNLGQNPKTDSQGIASFEIESTQHLKPFRAKLIHKDYQEYPIQDRVIILNSMKRREKPLELRFRGKLDSFAVQQIKLEPQTITLKDANNEIITKNFYKRGDTLTFTASIDTSKAQESEIKWAYKILNEKEQSLLQQKDSKTYNPLNKTTLKPTINDIPSELKQILQDKDNNAYFSNQSAYTIKDFKNNTQELESLYKGKTLTITIPTSFETSKQQVAIAIFAYKYEPNWQVCRIIHLNDYPQITIDCTLAETLRAYTRQDNIATLGFGVSYVCQRLWHDNPANAKELSKLIYIDSHSPDFIESVPNATMQKIVKEVLPRITLQEFAKDSNNKCPAIKSQIQEISDNNLRFYVELDWDRFYMQFPLMKSLEKEALSIITPERNKNIFKVPITGYELGRILTNNFLDSLSEFWKYNHTTIKKAIQSNKDSKSFSMRVTANLLEIAKNPKKADISNANNKIFSITNDTTNLQECEKLLSDIKPSDLGRHQMQYYSISDIDFGLEYKLSFEEKSNQAIALYALSGKFQIYYVLDSFEIERISDKEIAIYPTQIKAYIDDSFDFRDQDHIFNDDGSIKELGQPVGAWDYNKMKFDKDVSESQMNKYAEKSGIISATNAGAAMFLKSAINIEKYENYKRQNIYPIYNHDYQQTQKNFNLGLDFIVTSKSFKNLKIPNDYLSKRFYTRYFTLLE